MSNFRFVCKERHNVARKPSYQVTMPFFYFSAIYEVHPPSRCLIRCGQPWCAGLKEQTTLGCALRMPYYKTKVLSEVTLRASPFSIEFCSSFESFVQNTSNSNNTRSIAHLFCSNTMIFHFGNSSSNFAR